MDSYSGSLTSDGNHSHSYSTNTNANHKHTLGVYRDARTSSDNNFAGGDGNEVGLLTGSNVGKHTHTFVVNENSTDHTHILTIAGETGDAETMTANIALNFYVQS